MALTLDDIAPDVLAVIILMLHDSSRKTIFSLLRANRSLYNATIPFVVRDSALDFSPEGLEETNSRIDRWLSSPDVLKSIRKLTIHGTNDAAPNDDKWHSLVKLFRALTGLKQVCYDCLEPFPVPVLDALHSHHPTVRLDIDCWIRRSPDTPFGGDPSELALAQSSILRSLNAHLFSSWSFPGLDLQRPAFMRIVTLAPNLESYRYSTWDIGGCLIYTSSEEELAKQNRLAEQFRVHNPVERKVFTAIHDEAKLGSDFLYDLAFVDWSKLHTLSGVSLGQKFIEHPVDGSVFKSLKSLSVNLSWMERELAHKFDAFFASVPPLESLSILGHIEQVSLPLLLTHHGDTLQTLQLHEDESWTIRRTLRLEELMSIRDACPQLQNFVFDIERTVSGEREREIYSLLSTFSPLRKVDLSLDMGLPIYSSCRNGDPEAIEAWQAYKELDEAALKEIWHSIGGKRLEKLTVRVGKEDREMVGFPPEWYFYEQRGWGRFTLTPHERDDRADEVVIDILRASFSSS